MDDPLLQEQTPAEYFKGLVESALARQHLRASELTSYYLVDLLCRFVRPDRRIPFNDDTNQPLALRLARALETGGMGCSWPRAPSFRNRWSRRPDPHSTFRRRVRN